MVQLAVVQLGSFFKGLFCVSTCSSSVAQCSPFESEVLTLQAQDAHPSSASCTPQKGAQKIFKDIDMPCLLDKT
ncbi:hypothetical protein BDV19DRAFT_375243 [Aspergillus venezuelensis]